MSKTGQFLMEIEDLSALDYALRDHLQSAENCLNSLFNKREKIIRLMNNQKWDQDQYLLDDLQQKLSDVRELLAEFSALSSPLDKFLAA